MTKDQNNLEELPNVKIVNDYVVSSRISKNIEIEIDDNKTIVINKWFNEDEYEVSEGDWGFADMKSEDIYNKLSEDYQDEIMDLINNFNLN